MESDQRKCRGPCGQTKVRILKGKWNKKDKRYVDEHNDAWNGSLCPVCHREQVKMRAKVKRTLAE